MIFGSCTSTVPLAEGAFLTYNRSAYFKLCKAWVRHTCHPCYAPTNEPFRICHSNATPHAHASCFVGIDKITYHRPYDSSRHHRSLRARWRPLNVSYVLIIRRTNEWWLSAWHKKAMQCRMVYDASNGKCTYQNCQCDGH